VDECRSLRLAIPRRRLAVFDEAGDGFRLEAGLHRLVVARHVEDPGLAVEVTLEGGWLGP
jgi:beta-glucosidase